MGGNRPRTLTARLLCANLASVQTYEHAIHATIHPAARGWFEADKKRRCHANWTGALLDVIDFFPISELEASLLGDHHRITSGTADALEFQRVHRLLHRFRVGGIGKLRFSMGAMPLFLMPIENGFDIAPLRVRARSRSLPRLDEPRLIRIRIATSLMIRLSGIDAIARP